MSEIFVLVEHRQGKIRDITYEMLGLGEKIATQQGATLTAVLLGNGVNSFAEDLATRAPKVLVVEDGQLENFNSLSYQKVLSSLIPKYQPLLTLIGHTAFGMDLAPSLSTYCFWNGLGPESFGRDRLSSGYRLYWPFS